jgi:hypothetical protein
MMTAKSSKLKRGTTESWDGGFWVSSKQWSEEGHGRWIWSEERGGSGYREKLKKWRELGDGGLYLFISLESPITALSKKCYLRYTYYSARTKSAIKGIWNKVFVIYNSTSDSKVLL